MKIVIVTPAGARSKSGNRNTARRWAHFLRRLGHRAEIQVQWDGHACDLMLALHARKSYDSIKRFAGAFPRAPLVLALTGTDLYRDIRSDETAKESMRLATRMIVLQEMGLEELAPDLRSKTRVIYQSTRPIKPQPPLKSCFEICVIGHLREEKDPFRCAMALSYLRAKSRIRIFHLGKPMSPEMEQEARDWMARDSRYRWLGELPHWQACRRLARSRLMVISSRMEGGANVVCEALAANVPVIASDVSGNVGMLGKAYAGYYPVEDERALAALLSRAETDHAYYQLLKQQCRTRKALVQPGRELNSLKRMLAEAAAERRSGN